MAKQAFAAFGVGLIFSLGLGISGMTRPEIVMGFLDLTGTWNPALLFVMVGAVGVHMTLYRLIAKRPSPLLATEFHIPTRRDIDRRLIMGSAIFGLGWGMMGICPGPALTSLASGKFEVLFFVLAMLFGMKLSDLFSKH